MRIERSEIRVGVCGACADGCGWLWCVGVACGCVLVCVCGVYGRVGCVWWWGSVGACGVCGPLGGEKVSLAALLSGYLGKSGHLPRFVEMGS